MSMRELIGTILLAVAVILVPFGYWLSIKWGLLAIAIAIPGVWLYFSKRVVKRDSPEEIGGSDTYPPKDLRGFNGADHFDKDED